MSEAPNPHDVTITAASLYFLPVETRVALKFGAETLTHVTCARVSVTVRDRSGREAIGWGETPLSVQWVWPSSAPYDLRHSALKEFCKTLTHLVPGQERWGHPMELGDDFIQQELHTLADKQDENAIPYLAALVCFSAFDIATHDAYGMLHTIDVYSTYTAEYMSRDLSHFLKSAPGTDLSFQGLYPADFLNLAPPCSLPVWHLVGGLDPLEPADLQGNEPDDGYPVTLKDWIQRDGLNCLKIKLRGNDFEWDYQRICAVGIISIEAQVDWLTTDFNCTVTDPAYVTTLLDRLLQEHPRIYGMILYVEQPFPYDMETHQLDVHSVSARKPLFMDESAHDWKCVALGRKLGWTGVALKTCKTQTGALLSLCWAKAHGMTLMVQDLTNPMLAQIPHVRLAAHADTIMGVESNGMQFYPEASCAEAAVHPGLYTRRQGHLDLRSLNGPGFGYRNSEIQRRLPAPEISFPATTSSPSTR